MKRWALLTLAMGTMCGVAYAANTKVCFEGENPSALKKPLKVTKTHPALKGFSGSGYIEIPWDRNKTKGIGDATYKIKVPQAGVYWVWARTFWANGCGNSVAVTVNGGASILLGEDGTYDQWHWVGGKTRVTLKSGLNTIVLKNKETGIAVDQFFFCTDESYTPTGKRPATLKNLVKGVLQ